MNKRKNVTKKEDVEKNTLKQDTALKEEEKKKSEKTSEKKEEKKEPEKASEKKEEKKEPEKTSEKKEEKKEPEKASEKKEEKKEPEKASEKKEEKKEPEKTSDKKEEKKEPEKASEKKEEKKEPEKTSDKKEEKKEPEKTSDKKEEEKKKSESASEKKEEKKEPEKASEEKESVKNNAISQSKRLEDAKAAAKETVQQKEQEKAEKRAGKKKALWISLASVAGLLLIAYVAGWVYFSSHFYQDVAINGVTVSGMDEETAQKTLDAFYADYTLTMTTIQNKKLPIKGKDISMKISLQEPISKCLKDQKAYAWFVEMFSHHDFTIAADASWDAKKLAAQLDKTNLLKKQTWEKPQDAYVGVKDGKFVIVKEILGTTIDPEHLQNAVDAALAGVLSQINLQEQECYVLPKVYDTDEALAAELKEKLSFGENAITLQLDDLTVEPGMELYDKVLEKRGDHYAISKKKVENYVKLLAKQYDTKGKERLFTTSFNSRKVMVEGKTFGYEIDQEETTNLLNAALTRKQEATVDVAFTSKGYSLQGENDIGNTYIEVNLSEQKVFGYKNGKKIAEGDCVSGKEAAGNGTCIGLYEIQDKLSPTVLRGQKKPVTKTEDKEVDGQIVQVTTTTYEYEYESPVTFWIQFNGGIGLHDAAGWRSKYGGDIYIYSGSHGCVNLPYDLAEKLYKNFEVGDPVVVYFWDNENRK